MGDLERQRLGLVKSIILILISISIAVGGQLLLKIGLIRLGSISVDSFGSLMQLFGGIIRSPLVLTGLFCYVLSAAIWLVVLSSVDLSFAYPFIGLTYVFILLISKFILKEDVNPIRWIGAVVITAGVVLVSRG
ncbi:MAG: EamA family transporter [Actinobacteria bacterium]|nr:EamA family transporter [Actinomycetota bacterium]